jgi:hypothetical protein
MSLETVDTLQVREHNAVIPSEDTMNTKTTSHLSAMFMFFMCDVFNMGGFEEDLYNNSLVRKTLHACYNANESVEYTVELINFRMGW